MSCTKLLVVLQSYSPSISNVFEIVVNCVVLLALLDLPLLSNLQNRV